MRPIDIAVFGTLLLSIIQIYSNLIMIYAFIDLNARLSLLIVVFNLIKYMQCSRLNMFTFSCLYIFKGRQNQHQHYHHHHHHHYPDNLENRNFRCHFDEYLMLYKVTFDSLQVWKMISKLWNYRHIAAMVLVWLEWNARFSELSVNSSSRQVHRSIS